MNEVFDEIVSGMELLTDQFMSVVGVLYEETEMTTEFLTEAACWMEGVWSRATAAVAEF